MNTKPQAIIIHGNLTVNGTEIIGQFGDVTANCGIHALKQVRESFDVVQEMQGDVTVNTDLYVNLFVFCAGDMKANPRTKIVWGQPVDGYERTEK